MIKVYSKPNCKYCDAAKNWLNNKGINFELIDITQVAEAREFVVSKGHKTVPQIYVGNTLIEGGYEGLSKLTSQEFHKILDNETGACLLDESTQFGADNGVDEDK